MQHVQFRLGADPEIFLQDAAGNPISSIGYINADKWSPMQIPDMPEGFTLQEDNVSLEYGIPPAASADEFVQHIQAVMEKSKEYLPNLSFSKLSCIIFPKEQLVHPLAHIFGCEPDYNAWTGRPNKPPKPVNKAMRSAGGHIHVETKLDTHRVVRAMDLFLGIPSVLMDKGEERKQMYGAAGAHREKVYGVEYRTLSNFWIFDEKLIRWAWANTGKALDFVDAGGDLTDLADRIIGSIDNNDKAEATKLVQEFDLEVVQ